MTRTPDEIKNGLEHCINGTSCRGRQYCEECAIASDCNPMHKDLQGYIQQLEAENAELLQKIEELKAGKARAESSCTQMAGLIRNLRNQLAPEPPKEEP